MGYARSATARCHQRAKRPAGDVWNDKHTVPVTRIVMLQKKMQQAGFQQLLQQVRCCYKNRTVRMLPDNATAHTAIKSLRLADKLNICLVWLPKQCPELNAMDHLWRSLKKDRPANHQYQSREEHAATAIRYIRQLSNQQARCKAGLLSDNF